MKLSFAATRRRVFAAYLIGLVCAAVSGTVLARPGPAVQGRVTQVSDGDSLWLQAAAPARRIEVRLVDVDAPEICQAWGTQARDALRAMVLRKTVVLHPVALDQYGRTLGRVSIDGVDVNAWLVRQGHAWSSQGAWGRGPLAHEEQAARTARRGLHAQPGAELPRDFRRRNGRCYVRRMR